METGVCALSGELIIQKDSSQESKEDNDPEKMETQSVDNSPITEFNAKPTGDAGDDSAPEQNAAGIGEDNPQSVRENDSTKKEDPAKEEEGEKMNMGAAAAPPNLPPGLCPRDAGFTSEKFKIEIMGLPRQFGFAQLRKRLSVTMGLKPHKLKALPNKNFAYVCFSSEEDREQALEAINGHVWKGKTLRAKEAQPAADPMKRKLEESAEKEESPTKRARPDNLLPPAVRLRSCVEPLWDMPYEKQLKCKTDKAKDALKAVASHGDVRDQFMKARKFNSGMCCALDPIIPSPVMEGYRNKSEFSVGRSEDDTETVVGFRFGLYKDGTDGVGSPSEVSIISPDSKKVVQSFEQYVRQSRYPPFNHRTHLGHWRQLTVRTTREGGGTLAVAEFVVNNASEEAMEEEKAAIHKYFTEGEGKSAGVTTFYFRPCSARTSNSVSEEPYQLVYGDGYIHETMGDMKFRISPSAFFQVNTLAAQVLYSKMAELCRVTPDTVLLDICCGTGTIGQSMAKNVSKVIGIEMCKEAIEDAEVNATLNGVTNVKYHCAKVESVIQDIMRQEGDNLGSNPVAILDPPRGGVQSSVIKSLRKCRSLNRIVYAACNPAGAKNNFVDLCRPESRKTAGPPFTVVQAVPIDMFPSTNHCELLVLFERKPHLANTSSESD